MPGSRADPGIASTRAVRVSTISTSSLARLGIRRTISSREGGFVTKGSPEEYYDLDGLKYRVKDLAPDRANAPPSLKILGRVMAAKDLRERLTPTS